MAVTFSWLDSQYRIASIAYAGQVSLQQFKHFYEELSAQPILPRFIVFETVNFIISPEIVNFAAERELTSIDKLIQHYLSSGQIEAILIVQPNKHPFFAALLQYAQFLKIEHKVGICRSQANALNLIYEFLQNEADELDDTQPSNQEIRTAVYAASDLAVQSAHSS